MKNKRPTIEIITEKPKLEFNKDQTVDVLLRVTVPESDQRSPKRPNLNLSMVIDRSGSMQGEKMRQAKEAAKYCIDQLLATDRIGCVVFDDQIDVLISSQKVENKLMLRRAVDSVQTNGSTALHEAWVRGGLQVSEHLDGDAINRVVLITDGQANVGETDTDRIVSQARQLADKGVSTSTIGIGRDFNEDLLLPMAESGGGNSWHVQEPHDMVRIFETELQGLILQIGHTVRLQIVTADGITVADVLNDFETDSSGRYKLPNLQAGSKLDLVVRLRVPAHAVGESIQLAEFRLEYIGQGSKDCDACHASLAMGFDTAEAVASLGENAEPVKAVQLLMNARARREAIGKMDRQDYAGAEITLSRAASRTGVLYTRAQSPALAEELRELDDLREGLKSRENDVMSRKRMAYGRETLRKNK